MMKKKSSRILYSVRKIDCKQDKQVNYLTYSTLEKNKARQGRREGPERKEAISKRVGEKAAPQEGDM